MKPIIDISYYQQPNLIDYDKLSNEVGGVILRAAYGTRADTAFNQHYAEFTKRGIPVGCYHYICEYVTVADQVKVLLAAVKGKSLKLGYWCDVEIEQGADRLTARTVIDYMTAVEARLGEWGMYVAHWCWKAIMGDEYARYASRKCWMAAYVSDYTKYIPHGWSKPFLWQYTSSGKLAGYAGSLDVNKFMGTEQEYKNFVESLLIPAGNSQDSPQNGSGAQQVTDILLNIPPLAQRDPRWSNNKMGTTNILFGNQGCLVTCATMELRYLLGIDIYPGEFNTWLGANGGYHEGNLFVWGSMNGFDERITFGYRYNGAYLDKIDEQLAKRMPVIVNVDLYPNTPAIDQHWVLVVGKVGGRYIIHDPWYGAQLWFDEWYGDPRTGVRIVCTYNFTGEIPNPIPIPEPEPIPVDAKTAVTLVDIGLRVRKGAGTSFGVWATAPKGTKLDVLEVRGDWIRCGWNQWVISRQNGVDYLRFE